MNTKTNTNQTPQLVLAPLIWQQILSVFTELVEDQGYRPVIHFELEGTYESSRPDSQLDFGSVNKGLKQAGIAGHLKTEYWQNQWEFVSDFAGQSPTEEASHLHHAMNILPDLMLRHGARRVRLTPITWYGDKGRYAPGSNAIFITDSAGVHIPNAVQINISIADAKGQNLLPDSNLGEWLQHHLLQTSFDCCLLFLPEEDAFKRLLLRSEYGLDAELSSPFELSGGHQGSIALYKQRGKHNQDMGKTPFIYDKNEQVLSYQHDWRSTCRVEHRLGATSALYDPFLNVLFILLNMLQTLDDWQPCQSPPEAAVKPLPTSLFGRPGMPGAWHLFEQETWFTETYERFRGSSHDGQHLPKGQQIKSQYLRLVERRATQATLTN